MESVNLDCISKLPSEFSAHSATIALYPFRSDVWRDNAKHAQELLLSAINLIAKHERVILCTKNPLDDKIITSLNANIEIVYMDYDDIWARDISPFFPVINGKMHGVCFGFNAWGGINEGAYYPWDKDAAFGRDICNYLNIDSTIVDLIMEGGALIHNGEGLAIVTESVLLNENRNPNISKARFEDEFHRLLGINKVIWLQNGFTQDETDGHVDVFLNFVDSHNLLLAWTEDIQNPQYSILHNIYEKLIKSTAVDGKKLCIHKLLMPDPLIVTFEESRGIEKSDYAIERNSGMMLYPTYNNAYIFNGGVLVPTFGVNQDEAAIDCYKKFFPQRKIYPLYSKEFLIGGGNYHCIFHEIPEV